MRDDRQPYLRIRDLLKKFGNFTALQDISLDIEDGEFVCFLGPSGCGKTTLLRAIAGLDIQTAGTIEQAGKDVSALPPFERDFGIVFQSYALFPNLTVQRNVAYGLENQGIGRSAISTRVGELLDLVGLPDQGKKYPAQLSGGQQQRVALARALATSPGLLLLDEPLSALDAKVRVHLRHEIKSLQESIAVTTIMVTHDQEEALAMADRIVVMNHGVIEQVGTPAEIYGEPATLFVADFIGEMNQVSGQVSGPDKVKLGDLDLKCPGHGFENGSEVIVAVRPEDIVPHGRGGQASGGENAVKTPGNAFQTTIGDMEFLGSYWRAEMTGGKMGTQKLIANVSINAVRRMGLAPGKTIKVELPVDRLKIFAPGI